MPKPTPDEALALLREMPKLSEDWNGEPPESKQARSWMALHCAGTPEMLAGLVAELYEALSRAQTMPLLIKTWEKSSRNNAYDSIQATLRACEDALVAWAEGVAVPDATEPQRGG
jgi:hypothetical protein